MVAGRSTNIYTPRETMARYIKKERLLALLQRSTTATRSSYLDLVQKNMAISTLGPPYTPAPLQMNNCEGFSGTTKVQWDMPTNIRTPRLLSHAPFAAQFNCPRSFTLANTAKEHAKTQHLPYPCPFAGDHDCNCTSPAPEKARQHGEQEHNLKACPCPHSLELGCKGMFTTITNANVHVNNVHLKMRHPCPLREDFFCNETFSIAQMARNTLYENTESRKTLDVPTMESHCAVANLGYSSGEEMSAIIHWFSFALQCFVYEHIRLLSSESKECKE